MAELEKTQSEGTPVKRTGYVFISFKSDEAEAAESIQTFLEKEGYACWRAPKSLHQAGTQDYSTEILNAIRGAKCLLFLLSNRALGSHWVRREVQYAMEKCELPVIPYVVSAVSQSKKEHDAVYLSLSLDKQILNEDLSNDRRLILPYLEKAFSGKNQTDAALLGQVEIARAQCSWTHYRMCRARADFFLNRISELEKADNCVGEGCIAPTMRRRELIEAIHLALDSLIDIMVMNPTGDDGLENEAAEMRDAAELDLSRIVYNHDKRIRENVFVRVEPYAEDGVPWANFVLYPRYFYPSDTRGEAAPEKAFKVLERAVSDGKNPYAMIRFGVCRMWGIGCGISATNALFWFERALDLNCVQAYEKIARIYEDGWADVAKNRERCLEFYEKGVAEGDTVAMWRLGNLYGNEAILAQYFDKDEKSAEEYRRKSEDLYRESYERGDLTGLIKLVGLSYQPYDIKYDYSSVENERMARKFAVALGSCGSGEWNGVYAEHLLALYPNDPDRIGCALDYAVTGLSDKVPECAMAVAKIAVWRVQADFASERDSSVPIRLNRDDAVLSQFVETELRSVPKDRAKYLRMSLDNFKKIDEVERPEKGDNLSQYVVSCGTEWPETSFWRHLSSCERDPSALKNLNLFTPSRFLHELRAYGGEPDSRFRRVMRLWEMLRTLDCERSDAQTISRRQYALLLPGIDRSFRHRLSVVLAAMRGISQLATDLYGDCERIIADSGLEPKSDSETRAIEREDDEESDDALVTMIEKFLERICDYAGKNPHSALLIAKMLCDTQFEMSHPRLEVALHYAHLAYAWGGSPLQACLLAYLFVVSNARYREADRNEATLYRVRDALVKAVYMNDLDAMPLVIEACLFGLEADGASVAPDFELLLELSDVIQSEISRISEYKAEQTESITHVTEGQKELAARIAYALGRIFSDRGLCLTGRKEEGWGVVSLCQGYRSCDWFAYAHRCALSEKTDKSEPETGAFNEMAMIFRETEKALGWFKSIGYFTDEEKSGILTTCQNLSSDGLSVEVNDANALESETDRRRRWLVELAKRLDGLGDSIESFPHVYLEPWLCDFAVSNDDRALVFLAFPEDADFEVDGLSDGPDEPHATADCISNGVVVGRAVFTLLDRFCEKLRGMEANSSVTPAIVANARTVQNFISACDYDVAERDMRVCSYDGLEQAVREYFDVKSPEAPVA